MLASNGFDAGFESAQPIIDGAGIPLIANSLLGPNERNNANAFGLGTAAGSYFVAPLLALKSQGAKKVFFIAEDQPSSHDTVANLEKIAPKVGIGFESAYADPATPDYTPLVQTAVSKGTDAIWAFVSEPHCVQFVQAARQAGYKGQLMASTCSDFIKALGDQSVGVLTFVDHVVLDVAATAPPRIQDNIKVYQQAMTAAGKQDILTTTGAGAQFGLIMNLKTILETIPAGPIDKNTIRAAAAKASLPSWDSPDLNCANHPWPSEKSSCRAELLILKTVKNGNTISREPASTTDFGFRSDPDPLA